MKRIYPILLAGGSGTRLWPLSRKSYPKQFSALMGDKTLFQQSALRLTSSDIVQFSKPLTLTNVDFRFIVREQLKEIDLETGDILIEPEGKNTAASILSASIHIMKQDPSAVLLVSPADHVIPEVEALHNAVKTGLYHLKKGKIVTFGITPSYWLDMAILNWQEINK